MHEPGSELAPGIPRPPHVYIPGKTPRHPEGWFDELKSDVGTVARLEESMAWRAGLIYLREGYYWESHEMLEAVWMATPEDSLERVMCQVLIQTANARLKRLMGRPKAAKRLSKIVHDLLDVIPRNAAVLGLGRSDLVDILSTQDGK